jgi:hypothetical protein
MQPRLYVVHFNSSLFSESRPASIDMWKDKESMCSIHLYTNNESISSSMW